MNQAQQTTPRSDRGALKWLLVILVLLILAALGYYYWTTTQTSNVTTPAATPTPTAKVSATPTTSPSVSVDWKTYTNNRVNYSFEYPASGLQLNLDETIKYPSTKAGDSKYEDLVQFATSSTTYAVRADISGHATTVDAWITGTGTGGAIVGPGFPSSSLSDYTKITLGGVTAYTSKSLLSTYAIVGTKYYSIIAYTGITPKTGTDLTYSHLLSSFQFTQ